MSSRLTIYTRAIHSEPSEFDKFLTKAKVKFSSLKCHKYADSKYVVAAAAIAVVALAAISNFVGAGIALGVGLLALGKVIYKNQEAIKDFLAFGLFKKSTPEEKIQQILAAVKVGEEGQPIFIDGKKYIFDQCQAPCELSYEIVYKSVDQNEKLLFSYNGIVEKFQFHGTFNSEVQSEEEDDDTMEINFF